MIDNCDVTAEVTTPKPLLNTEEPICPSGESACADGTCLPTTLFCDGHADCFDYSDEGWCDPDHDPNAAPTCDLTNVRTKRFLGDDRVVLCRNTKTFSRFSAPSRTASAPPTARWSPPGCPRPTSRR